MSWRDLFRRQPKDKRSMNSTEVSKTIDPERYPDLLNAGGLAPALQKVLDELDAGLRVVELDEPRFIVYANVRTGSRSSQVMVAAQERAFSVDFWNQGVQYGHGWNGELQEVARAIVAFQVRLLTIEALVTDFPWVKPTANAEAHEQGAEAFVAEAWQGLLRWLGTSEPVGSPMRRLLPLVIEAEHRAELRKLLPFTSMDHLCFSRTTGYPYTQDCPVAYPVGDNRFRVMRREGPLGEGDAARAADLLVANLPEGCGAARQGTAEDRPHEEAE